MNKLILMLLMLSVPFVVHSETRIWTANGKTASGELVQYQDELVFIKLDNGRTVSVKREVLSDDDILFVSGYYPTVLRFYGKVGSFSASINRVTGIANTVDLFVSNDGMMKFSSKQGSYEIPYLSNFWDLFEEFRPYGAKDCVCIKLLGVDREVVKIEKKVEYDDQAKMLNINLDEFCMMQINPAWTTEFSLPLSWNNSANDKFPKFYMRKTEMKKIAMLKEPAKSMIERIKKHPRLIAVEKHKQKLEELKKSEQQAQLAAQHEEQEELKRKRMTFSFANIQKTTDKFTGTTSFRNKRETSKELSSESLSFSLSIVQDKKSPEPLSLWATFRYCAKDWLFVDHVFLLAGTYRIRLDYTDPNRNVLKSGHVYEIGSIEINPQQFAPFIDAEKIECRFSGNNGIIDFVFSEDQLLALKEVLQFYFIKEKE